MTTAETFDRINHFEYAVTQGCTPVLDGGLPVGSSEHGYLFDSPLGRIRIRRKPEKWTWAHDGETRGHPIASLWAEFLGSEAKRTSDVPPYAITSWLRDREAGAFDTALDGLPASLRARPMRPEAVAGWDALRQDTSYLTGPLGLPENLVREAAPRVRCQPDTGSLCFGHVRLTAGVPSAITGYEIRGRLRPGGVDHFAAFSAGGQKGLFLLGRTQAPAGVVLFATAYDLLAYAAWKDIDPAGDTLLASTSGVPSRAVIDDLAGVAARMPADGRWVFAGAATPRSRREAERVRDRVREAAPTLRFSLAVPPDGAPSWLAAWKL